jgi:hypothetical protein
VPVAFLDAADWIISGKFEKKISKKWCDEHVEIFALNENDESVDREAKRPFFWNDSYTLTVDLGE